MRHWFVGHEFDVVSCCAVVLATHSFYHPWDQPPLRSGQHGPRHLLKQLAMPFTGYQPCVPVITSWERS